MNPPAPSSSDAIIGPGQPEDAPALYEVCLKTGNGGADGTEYFSDARWLGHRFVGPYLRLEPGFAWTLTDSEGVCGYVLAAPDSERFARRFETEWMPGLREELREMVHRHPDPRSKLESEQRDWFAHPTWFFPEPRSVYPSHLHIDLLPRAQGRGHGRRMVGLLLDVLAAGGSSGVHLGMHPLNLRARKFYADLGFQELALANETLYLGRRLSHGT